MNKRTLIAYTPLVGLILVFAGSIVFRNQIMDVYREYQMNKYWALLCDNGEANKGLDDKIVRSSDRGAWFARYQEFRDALVESGAYDKLEWEIYYLKDKNSNRSAARREDFLVRLDKATDNYKHRAISRDGAVQVFVPKSNSTAMFELVDPEISKFIDEVVSRVSPDEDGESTGPGGFIVQ